MKLLFLLLTLNIEYQQDHKAKRFEISNNNFILDSIKYKSSDKDCYRVMWKSKNYRIVYNYE